MGSAITVIKDYRDRKMGRFNVSIIDEYSRDEHSMKDTNVVVQNEGLYPKNGDLMQVARYCHGGEGSIYTPARMIETTRGAIPNIYIDLTDWKIPQIKEIGEKYETFLSPISGEEYDKGKREECNLRKEGIYYEIVLLNSNGEVVESKKMSTDKEHLWVLSNYQVDKHPSLRVTGNIEHFFTEIGGKTRDKLLVDAVLHPLVGLPKVLLREA